jgi:hypothetical protein
MVVIENAYLSSEAGMSVVKNREGRMTEGEFLKIGVDLFIKCFHRFNIIIITNGPEEASAASSVNRADVKRLVHRRRAVTSHQQFIL